MRLFCSGFLYVWVKRAFCSFDRGGISGLVFRRGVWERVWFRGSYGVFCVFLDKFSFGWLYEELELVERRGYRYLGNGEGECKDVVFFGDGEGFFLFRDRVCFL